ncbi:MAG: metallophosphoesterase [Bacilli bacterium]|nr:metallophosphoesterase [Bacilli bacterium]
MKKKLLYLSLVSLSLLACTHGSDYEIKDYLIEVPYQKDFKVLQLTDTHWLGDTNWEEQGLYDFTRDVVNKANPNFIVITGDLINNGTLNDWMRYCDFMDEFNIPWTLTFGNHDARCYTSMEKLTDYLNERSQSPNSSLKFINRINDPITGNANFAINLTENNSVKYQLIIVDSNRYQNVEYADDNYIQTDQINWYRNLVNYTTTNNGNSPVPSFVFFHIPLVEYLYAAEAVERGELSFNDEGEDSGLLNEKICCSHKNNGFFDAMKELKSTKAVFVGHDHVNNFSVDYQGIKLCYGLKSSDSVDTYHKDNMLGGRLITFDNDGGFVTTLVHHEEK